jgi:hypothetical protein
LDYYPFPMRILSHFFMPTNIVYVNVRKKNVLKYCVVDLGEMAH